MATDDQVSVPIAKSVTYSALCIIPYIQTTYSPDQTFGQYIPSAGDGNYIFTFVFLVPP